VTWALSFGPSMGRSITSFSRIACGSVGSASTPMASAPSRRPRSSSTRSRSHRSSTTSFSELADEGRETDAAIQRWVAELTPEILESDLAYSRSTGQSMVAPFWHVISHLFNHQTHHRGQVTTLLSQLGRDPGVTDFMITAFMPENATF